MVNLSSWIQFEAKPEQIQSVALDVLQQEPSLQAVTLMHKINMQLRKTLGARVIELTPDKLDEAMKLLAKQKKITIANRGDIEWFQLGVHKAPDTHSSGPVLPVQQLHIVDDRNENDFA